MPGFIKNNMLPPSETPTDESSEGSFIAENEELLFDDNQMTKHTDNKPLEIGSEVLSNENSSNKSTSVPQDCLSPLKSSGNILPNGFLNTSTDDDSLVNHRFSFNKQSNILSKGNKILYINLNVKEAINARVKGQKTKSNTNKLPPKVEKKFLHDSEIDLASEILNPNKVLKKSVPKVKISETWDHLELFAKMHREKLLKEKLGLHLPSRITELVNFFRLLSSYF